MLNKVKLSKNLSTRKRQAAKFEMIGTALEKRAFQHLKELFSRDTRLAHFDADLQLYIDLDSSKVWGMAAMLYHLAKALPEGETSEIPRKNVQPILFLSREINLVEKNYWPTELEVSGMVWVIRKIRFMVESTRKPFTIVYTDHSQAWPYPSK